MAPKRFPIWKVLLPGNANAVGAMKSFTDSPDPVSQFHSNRNRSVSPMWNMSCMRRRRSFPLSAFAATPSCLKLFMRSFWTCCSLGFACFILSASIPNVRYLVFVSPLFPWESCILSIWLYSFRMALNSSFLGGIRMLFSKLSESVAIFMKESSKWIELSKKLRKLHHSSKMAVLSSCWASW